MKGRKYINTPYKIYFEDLGLRNAAIGFRQHEDTHLMENIIYNELRYRSYNVDVGVVEAREGGKRKSHQIDFLASSGSKRYCIQSACNIPDEEKWIQETHSFDRVGDSSKKIIVVKNPVVRRQNEKGHLTIGLYEFLLNPDSLGL